MHFHDQRASNITVHLKPHNHSKRSWSHIQIFKLPLINKPSCLLFKISLHIIKISISCIQSDLIQNQTSPHAPPNHPSQPTHSPPKCANTVETQPKSHTKSLPRPTPPRSPHKQRSEQAQQNTIKSFSRDPTLQRTRGSTTAEEKIRR